jgi:hypothetical protein
VSRPARSHNLAPVPSYRPRTASIAAAFEVSVQVSNARRAEMAVRVGGYELDSGSHIDSHGGHTPAHAVNTVVVPILIDAPAEDILHQGRQPDDGAGWRSAPSRSHLRVAQQSEQ